MNLFTTYTPEELTFLANLPKLAKKHEISNNSIKIFENLSEKDLEIVEKKVILLKKGEIYTTKNILWIAKGEIGLLYLKEIAKKIKQNQAYGIKEFLNKKEYQILALKESIVVDIKFSLTPSKALSKLLLNLCKTI